MPWRSVAASAGGQCSAGAPATRATKSTAVHTTASNATRPATLRTPLHLTATGRRLLLGVLGGGGVPRSALDDVDRAVGVADDSDGYAEAWYLPAANDVPAGYATEGTWYEFFAGKAAGAYGVAVIRGIWGASNAEQAASDYLSAYDAGNA